MLSVKFLNYSFFPFKSFLFLSYLFIFLIVAYILANKVRVWISIFFFNSVLVQQVHSVISVSTVLAFLAVSNTSTYIMRPSYIIRLQSSLIVKKTEVCIAKQLHKTLCVYSLECITFYYELWAEFRCFALFVFFFPSKLDCVYKDVLGYY